LLATSDVNRQEILGQLRPWMTT